MNSAKKNKVAILVSLLYSLTASAQITPVQLKEFIADKYITTADIKYLTEIKEFYARLNYKTAWVQKDNVADREIILTNLQLSAGLGLQEKDYQFRYIQWLRNNTNSLQSTTDSLEAEIRITDAAIHFYNDIAYGNAKPALGYNGLDYPKCRNIPVLLADYISQNLLALLTAKLSPALPEITILENKIKWFNTIINELNFKETIITSNNVNEANQPLHIKLYQLGLIDSAKNIPANLLNQKIKEAQLQFGLLADGTLRSTTIRQLNVPLSVRLKQLNIAINYYRWLYCLAQNQSVIVVNIPAAYLKVYRNDKVVLEMRVILGKPSTPTPALASTVTEVILYPYWHVPYSIATKELLPAIRRNPGYIDAGNYQVLNKSGEIMDPYAINWQSLSTKYFPYTIRQSTGCDNALGLLKLNFYNPFGVYLHDTPNKTLFMLGKRYYSHGCMRMEDPMKLGHLILKNNSIAIDTLEQKGCLINQSPVTVKANDRMPVVVWYNPAGIDSTGRLLFYEDIYGKFDWMKK
ncbi:MAG: L,D-transpeptidase family protein [Chitinophagaceae bacterium]|nr:L,D-transpeptidase family protein [Chitinophagaceae bacterium]